MIVADQRISSYIKKKNVKSEQHEINLNTFSFNDIENS